MFDIKISDKIRAVAPGLKVAAITCDFVNSETNQELWTEFDQLIAEFQSQYEVEDINKREPIKANRAVYKALGKDPNRYRPSAEALCRRILKEKSLYHINTMVDLINLISVKSGYSIGGFDANRIQGDQLVLGVGEPNEVFDAIGRGYLNIEGLPVFRDTEGGIGTPTSDVERTKITLDTTRLLMIINAYSGEAGLKEAVDDAVGLLTKYAGASTIQVQYL